MGNHSNSYVNGLPYWREPRNVRSTVRTTAAVVVLVQILFMFWQAMRSEPVMQWLVSQRGIKAFPNLPSRGELVMVTASSSSHGFETYAGWQEDVYENRASYADRWGYEFVWANLSSYRFAPPLPGHWNKIAVLQDAQIRFPDAKWFWWLDSDALIMTPSIDISTQLLSSEGFKSNIQLDFDIPKLGGGPSGVRTPSEMEIEDVNMLIATDYWGINTGSFLLRQGFWTEVILDMMVDPLAIEKNWKYTDQESYVHMYNNHAFVRNHTAVVQQQAFNSYPEWNILGHHWPPGELVAHFPSCAGGGKDSMDRCYGSWQKHWEMKEVSHTPDWIRQQLQDGTAPIANLRPV